MNCLLLYYTGTFNTRFLTQKLKARLEAEGWSVDSYEINPLNNERLDLSSYDIIGLGYPIYGYCAPYAFLRFIRAQKFPHGMRVFIYKDSGETEHANDASSKYVVRKLRRDGVRAENEYHFLMPYNIHFRFDEKLVREMLGMDERLLDILVYELKNHVCNRQRYKLWPRLVSAVVSRPQYIGGDVNSFLYKVDMDRCIGCDLCIKRCPTQNIYRDSKGTIRFHHHCLMCMRCSLFCPKDAIHIGFLEDWGWKVNGGYNLSAIEKMPAGDPVITENTTGFFKCYIETYDKINSRHKEIFGE
ncbi:MAG: EFR1 family ferrodoxin [Bacteroidales bacterium]|nr:EFR1 family ferrodoxin [Bacteroidales bacterium]